MYQNIKIVKVNSKYCDYLRQFDNKVPYNAGEKNLRPFIGVLFTVDGLEYFAPLSSPKPKHELLKNTIDLIKINDGKLGVINFNNMIPVKNKNYELLDLNSEPKNLKEEKRQNLLKSQSRWINKNKEIVRNKAEILYISYKKNRLPKRIKDRCCNYKLLEEKCNLYKNKDKVKETV